MDQGELESLRELSRSAFGQSHRLEIMLAIANSPDGLVTQTELAQQLGISVSNVQKPVSSLVACGLLSEMPRGDSRSRYLMRNRSAAWDWAGEMRVLISTRAAVTPDYRTN